MSKSKRPSAPEQMRQYLAVSKRAGSDFDAAWDYALVKTKFWAYSTEERHADRAALEETKWAWRAAFHDQDIPGGAGLRVLAERLDVGDDTTVAPARVPPLKISKARAAAGDVQFNPSDRWGRDAA